MSFRSLVPITDTQDRVSLEGRDKQERAQAHIASLERRLSELTSTHNALTERMHRSEVPTLMGRTISMSLCLQPTTSFYAHDL